jgi:hypothetical protein
MKAKLELRSPEEFEGLLWAVRAGLHTLHGEWGADPANSSEDKREIRRQKRGSQRIHGRLFTAAFR